MEEQVVFHKEDKNNILPQNNIQGKADEEKPAEKIRRPFDYSQPANLERLTQQKREESIPSEDIIENHTKVVLDLYKKHDGDRKKAEREGKNIGRWIFDEVWKGMNRKNPSDQKTKKVVEINLAGNDSGKKRQNSFPEFVINALSRIKPFFKRYTDEWTIAKILSAYAPPKEQMYEAGDSYGAARETGISRQYITLWWDRAGFERHDPSPEELKKYGSFGKKRTMKVIAALKEYGTVRDAVRYFSGTKIGPCIIRKINKKFKINVPP